MRVPYIGILQIGGTPIYENINTGWDSAVSVSNYVFSPELGVNPLNTNILVWDWKNSSSSDPISVLNSYFTAISSFNNSIYTGSDSNLISVRDPSNLATPLFTLSGHATSISELSLTMDGMLLSRDRGGASIDWSSVTNSPTVVLNNTAASLLVSLGGNLFLQMPSTVGSQLFNAWRICTNIGPSSGYYVSQSCSSSSDTIVQLCLLPRYVSFLL